MHDLQFTKRRTACLTLAMAVFVAACVTTGTYATPESSSPTVQQGTAQAPAWRVTTMPHVDLWLHGFAMLTSDTGLVPFFARGYKQQIMAAKRARNVMTQLDANRAELSSRFATTPALTNAQFLAMYFGSFSEIVNATDLFIRSSGNPRAASDPEIQRQIALLAAMFPTQADRNWLRLFVQSLEDENAKFFSAYAANETQARQPAYTAFVERWLSTYYPKLSRFLNNTQQVRGQIVPSIPLGGEGRTINDGKQANLVAVLMPKTVEAVPEALFVFAHEVVAGIAQEAINDNTTPAQQRSGATAGYVGNSAVRGGALLMKRLFPDLADDYMRFYLRTANRPMPTGDPSQAFATAFPLPEAIVQAIDSRIGLVIGGI